MALEVSDPNPDIENPVIINSVCFKGPGPLILKMIPLYEIFNPQGRSFVVSEPEVLL